MWVLEMTFLTSIIALFGPFFISEHSFSWSPQVQCIRGFSPHHLRFHERTHGVRGGFDRQGDRGKKSDDQGIQSSRRAGDAGRLGESRRPASCVRYVEYRRHRRTTKPAHACIPSQTRGCDGSKRAACGACCAGRQAVLLYGASGGASEELCPNAWGQTDRGDTDNRE